MSEGPPIRGSTKTDDGLITFAGGDINVDSITNANDISINAGYPNYPNKRIKLTTDGTDRMDVTDTGVNVLITTPSSSFTTGAFTVAGGVGVTGDTYIHGNIYCDGTVTGGTSTDGFFLATSGSNQFRTNNGNLSFQTTTLTNPTFGFNNSSNQTWKSTLEANTYSSTDSLGKRVVFLIDDLDHRGKIVTTNAGGFDIITQTGNTITMKVGSNQMITIDGTEVTFPHNAQVDGDLGVLGAGTIAGTLDVGGLKFF